MAICNFQVNDAIVLEKYVISTHLTDIVVALAYLKKKSMYKKIVGINLKL